MLGSPRIFSSKDVIGAFRVADVTERVLPGSTVVVTEAKVAPDVTVSRVAAGNLTVTAILGVPIQLSTPLEQLDDCMRPTDTGNSEVTVRAELDPDGRILDVSQEFRDPDGFQVQRVDLQDKPRVLGRIGIMLV